MAQGYYSIVPRKILWSKTASLAVLRTYDLIVSRFLDEDGNGKITPADLETLGLDVKAFLSTLKKLKQEKEFSFEVSADGEVISVWRYGQKDREPRSLPIPIITVDGAEKKPNEVKELIITFQAYCKNILGFNPMVSWAIDGALIKKRLNYFKLDQIKDMFDFYLRNVDQSKSQTYIGIRSALSDFAVNRWQMAHTDD